MPLLLHAVSDNVHISAAAIAMKRVLEFFTVTFLNTSHFVLLVLMIRHIERSE